MELTGSEKPDPNPRRIPGPRRNPTVLRMVLEALQAREQRQGISVVAIKQFILLKYPTVNAIRLTYLLRQALSKGVNRGLLTRPLNSKARGATGSFKLVSKEKRTAQHRKMATRKPGKAQKKGPKNPSKVKKEPPDPGKVKMLPQKLEKVEKVPTKSDAAEKKASNKGREVSVKVTKLGEPKKVKVKAPPSAEELSGKSAVKGGASSKAETERPRKTDAGNKSSKAKTPKGKNGTTFPSTKATASASKAPRKVASDPGKEPEAKDTAPPKDKGSSGARDAPGSLARKPGAPQRRPELPAKVSSSKVHLKKAKPESSKLG
ncbi:PREDICTED: histone H1oo-like [Elephantulus edwardii]|uniref:histone H1oo-like n=1 Tax=Elephantulus edwardii TaxID=28737 RepID=UPI0003F0EB4A|nr:PREDICTED: histone H1oo-like [Elephantulus edwardii]